MTTIRLPPDFNEFLKLLNANGVEYLLVGGYAVGYYGYPRATADIDIWIAKTRPNATRVVAALAEFGFQSAEVTEDVFLQDNKILRMGLPPLRIELFTDLLGLRFEDCYPLKVTAQVGELTVHLIDLQNLKLNKRSTARSKDLDDLEHLP